MTPYMALQLAVQTTAAPMLEFVSHQQAHEVYDWKVTRNTLNKLGFNAHDSSTLANTVSGNPRERIEKLIARKHIIIPRGYKPHYD